MTIDTNELLEAVCKLSEQQQIKMCATGSLKGGLIVGTSAAVAGFLLGPVGLAIGGTVGGLTAACCAKGQFKSVYEVVMNEMTVAQREELKRHFIRAFENSDITDLSLLLPFIMNNANAQQLAIQTATSFITKELGYRVAS